MRKRLGLAVTECTWPVAFPAGGTQRRAATRLGTVAVAFPRERGREPNGRFRLSGGSSSFLNEFLAAFAMPAAVRQPASPKPSRPLPFRTPCIKSSHPPSSHRNQSVSSPCHMLPALIFIPMHTQLPFCPK